MDLSYWYPVLFLDGNIQDGDTLSPTDIEANLSTEVALTVLDVLELFVHHHKVFGPFIVYNLKLQFTPQTPTVCVIYFMLLRGIYFHV